MCKIVSCYQGASSVLLLIVPIYNISSSYLDYMHNVNITITNYKLHTITIRIVTIKTLMQLLAIHVSS